MNREILFRGKRQEVGQFATTTNHEWVYGGYVKDCSGAYIHSIMYTHRMVKVDPATVGQYIGMTDKNGVKIFEGDIVSHQEAFYEVKYSTEWVRFIAVLPNGVFNPVVFQNCNIAGNIHDNPELLEALDETV